MRCAMSMLPGKALSVRRKARRWPAGSVMAMLTGTLMERDSAWQAERMVEACVAVRMCRSVGWVPMLLVVRVEVDMVGGGCGGDGKIR